MPLSLSFTNLYDYDLAQPGITLPVQLISGQLSADVNAKLDTGATHCIFQRFIGEELGLTIEDVLVCFAKDHSFVRNVLGRSGFLNRVLFGLNDYAGRLYLGNPADVE
jgi:hypothetical protein